MRAFSFAHRCFGALGAIGALATAACDDPLELPPAQFSNAVDTITIHALRGTGIVLPSAFDIVGNALARTDRGEPFDFAFDIESSGRPVLLPAGALGLVAEAGILVSAETFDGVTSAPLQGYVVDSAIGISTGTVFVGRSRGSSQQCAILGSLPRYGKFRVLGFDAQQRVLTVETLVNANCGYRGLEPGIPTS